jgi:hypothetical protein
MNCGEKHKMVLHAIAKTSQIQRRNELLGATSRGALAHSYILGAIGASAKTDNTEMAWKHLE